MELRFSDDNYEKYWQQNVENVEKTTKKKKISFDDILTNMNLVVNKGGVLQFMSINKELEQNFAPDPQQPYSNPQQPYSNPQQPYSNPQQPLDHSVKHSYIYNKYFKDYNDATPAAPEVKVPKTKEEYLKMLVEEKIRQNEERKRISQIKSTKLLFTTNVGNQGTIPVSKNGLRKMGFQ